MILNKVPIYFIFFQTIVFLGQRKKDSVKVIDLNEVVVTGQLNRQSIKKSVFEVTVVSRKDIELQAGNNLADILNQTLNLNIIPNSSSGKSTVQLFGLDGQYFKILVDNIPLINDQGLGNNTDLTQINLDDIAQIEIVEGSMGVQYGSNAVTGIINIITKKNSKYNLSIKPYIQEESVGNEFGLFNKGRHIQSLLVTKKNNKNIFTNISISRNDFKGFFDGKKGKNYLKDDGKRGYEWLPKNQFSTKFLLNYKKNDFTAFLKSEIFTESINRYNTNVIENLNSATQTTNPTANDDIFNSERFYNHLNLSGKVVNKLFYNISLSYQKQIRKIESYTYEIKSNKKFNINKFDYLYRKGFYSRGFFGDFIDSDKYNLQLGYEISSIKGYALGQSGNFKTSLGVNSNIFSYDLFTSSDFNITDKFTLKFGARGLFSSKFKNQFAVSINSKILFKNGYVLRAILGSSPRQPNYQELYTYFVDSNHDIRGDENLKTEKGKSLFLHLKKKYDFGNNTFLNSKLSSWYIDVNDRIELIIVKRNPISFKYNNIDQYKNWGVSLKNTLKKDRINLSFGASLSGTSKILNSREINKPDYLYSLQLNSNFSYMIPNYSTIFSTYIKYNGPVYQFIQTSTSNGKTQIKRGKQNGFTWINASIKKSFNAFDLTLGVRNIANITSVNTSSIEAGAHSGPPNSILLGYGRSYFFKVSYNFNLK